jgi:hypothetical protein
MFGEKVLQSTSITGTGAYSLDTSVGEFRDFREGFSDGETLLYVAENADGTIWEIGWGVLTYGPPDTLSRTVLYSSTGAPIGWQTQDAPIYVYSAPLAVALKHLMLGGFGLGRPAWARIGMKWNDDSSGVSTTWKEKRIISTSSADDVEKGRVYTDTKIYVPSPRKLWLDRGAANRVVTTDDIGSVNLFDVTASNRTMTLPAGSTVGHGFALEAMGYGSSLYGVVVTPNGTDKIDQAAGGASITVPGLVKFKLEWDGAKSQWRMSAIAGGLRLINDAAPTVTPADRTLAWTALTAARNVTLPPAASFPPGTPLTIIDLSGNASETNYIAWAPYGTDTIDGANLIQAGITVPRGSSILISDGISKWAPLKWSVVYKNSLGADVALSASVLGTGPRVVQGNGFGRWRAYGQIVIIDPTTAAGGSGLLTDGVSNFDSLQYNAPGANGAGVVPLTALISNPAGDIRILGMNTASSSGSIKHTASGFGLDSTLTVERVP